MTQRKYAPNILTPQKLKSLSLRYLGRYASSTENLRRILMRVVNKSVQAHGTNREEACASVEDIIRRFLDLGYLNDRVYAETRAESLIQLGRSIPAVRQNLQAKGVPDVVIARVIEDLTGRMGNLNRCAAVAFAKRRHIGPWRLEGRSKNRKRDLAALGRQGFSYQIACRIVDASSIEECELILASEE